MRTTYLSNSAGQTRKLGRILARKILKKSAQKTAFVVRLEGGLGGGKTTFLQGFSRGLGIRQRILSPTFVIMKKFKIPRSNFKNFYHFDCYRIKKLEELSILGLRSIMSQPENIVAIEWADKIKKFLPGKILTVKFKFLSEGERRISIIN